MARSKRNAITVAAPSRSPEEVVVIIKSNSMDPARATYAGLTTDEIATYSRRLMFGANAEAFPSEREWSRIVN